MLVPMRWLRLLLVGSRTGGSLLIGLRRYLVLGPHSLVWCACWLDTPCRSATSASKVVQDNWDIYREELEVVLPDLILALRSAFDKKCVDEFWNVWSAGAEAGLLQSWQRAGGPVSSGLSASLGEVPCRSGVDLGAGLLVVVVPVSCTRLVRVMKFMCRLSILSTPPLLLRSGVGQSRWLMFLRASVRMTSHRVVGCLDWKVKAGL